MEKRPTIVSAFFIIIRSLLLLALLLTYMLGLGIAHHVLAPFDLTKAIQGFVLIVLILEMRAFLEAYYRHPAAPENRAANPVKVEDRYLTALEQFPRPMLLYVAFVIMAAGALLVMILAIQASMPPAAYVVLAAAFLVSFFSAAPPVSLAEKGYGDIIEAILVANAAPALALAMQLRELHVLLVLLTLPLTLMYLALRITVDLREYGKDSLRNRQTMLVRIGWERGVTVHNAALAASYLLIGLFAAFQLPWSLIWPQLLSLPLAVFQVIQILQIASGAKPNWRLLVWTASATFGLAAYMIAITLWIR